MKIAIHDRKGSYSERWIAYCEKKRIDYKLVDAYSSDIIKEVEDCDIFMWHHHHGIAADVNFAKQLLFSLEQAGKVVFPNFKTGWHFDDKLGQKYLFEALGIPVAPSYAFYSEKNALKWAKNTTYPKIFKLRGGAGSSNVHMVKTFDEAKKYINKSFSGGFHSVDRVGILKDRISKFLKGKGSIIGVLKGFALLFIKRNNQHLLPIQKGYVYFQEFIENDGFDYRMTVCRDKCIPWVRYCRKNDFRASGGHDNHCDPNLISKELLDLAFVISDKLDSLSCAFDFVKEKDTGKLFLIENSYCYGVDDDEFEHGYFDRDGNWHSEAFNGIDWMIEEAINYYHEGKA